MSHMIRGNSLKELRFVVQTAFLKLHPDGVIVHIVPYSHMYEKQSSVFGFRVHRITPENTETLKLRPSELMDDEILQSTPHLMLFDNPDPVSGVIYGTEEIEGLVGAFRVLQSIVLTDKTMEGLSHSRRVPDLSKLHDKVVSAKMTPQRSWIKFTSGLHKLFDTTKEVSEAIFTPRMLQSNQSNHLNRAPNERKLHKTGGQLYGQIFHEILVPHLVKLNIQVNHAESAAVCMLNFEKHRFDLAKTGVTTSKTLSQYLLDMNQLQTIPGVDFGFLEDMLIVQFNFGEVEITTDHTGNTTYNRQIVEDICLEFTSLIDILTN